MAALPKDLTHDLKTALSEHLPWHGARIGFLAQFLLALLKVRSVSLAELATGFGGKAKVESHYKRLQRFFRGFEINQDAIARLLVRLVPVGDGPWRLALGRTHRQSGRAAVSFLGRGQVETLFGCLKSRGFNLEDTHLTHPERLAKLMGLLAMAFAWTCRTGELLHDGPSPI